MSPVVLMRDGRPVAVLTAPGRLAPITSDATENAVRRYAASVGGSGFLRFA